MSSVFGPRNCGKRLRRTSTTSLVSSTASVVWVRNETCSGFGTSTSSASRTSCTMRIAWGASPWVPSTSSWPTCPTRKIVSPSLAKCRASACTLLTRGQVASITSRRRSSAVCLTAGDTPCAEKTTVASSGTWSSSSTKTAPRRSRSATTCSLCTICLRTYTGAPRCASANSTISIARSTPAQNERGLASSTRRGPAACAHSASAPLARRRLRNPWTPAAIVRGSRRLRSATSRTTRTTAKGRPSAASASQADSMSTASTPSSIHARRSAGPAIRSIERIGPTCTRRPRRRSAAARRALPGTGTGIASSRRSSVAHTMSPARSCGATPPQKPTTATAGLSTARPRAAAMRARAGPMPERTTVQPGTFGSAAASILSGAKTSSRLLIEDPPERHHREDLPVEVVVDVEVAGEARACVVGLVPAAVAALRLDEPAHGTLDRGASHAGRVEAEQRPRRLRRGRRAAPSPRRVAVGAEVLAEAAVLVLHPLEPGDGGARAWMLGEVADGKRGKDGAGPVDVVRTPAAEPRAVALLLAEQPVDPASRRVSGSEAFVREHLDHVRGHVGARRIGDGTEVAERKLCRQAARVVHVERRPPAVTGLHAERPRDAVLGRSPVLDARPPQREHDDGGVVDVGIVVVRELEREPTRLQVRPAHGPVTAYANLAAREPHRAAGDRFVTRVEARVEQGEHRERAVPDRRLAGLEPAALLVLDREPVEAGERVRDHGVVERIAERAQRDDRPHPRRLDAAPRTVCLLALDDPLLGRAERAPAQRSDRLPLVAVQAAVDEREEARPRLDRHDRLGSGAKLVDSERDGHVRSQRRRDRQRDERLPRPAAERVDGKRRARRQQDLLRRQHGHVLPRPEREQRQPHAREDARSLDAAEVADQLRGRAHVSRVRRIAREAQRHVRLDGRRHVGGTGVEGRPASVLALLRADPPRGRVLLLRREDAEVVPDEEVLRVDRHVRLQLALPPAVRMLEPAQVLAATGERAPCGVDTQRCGDAHATASTASCARPCARSESAPRAAARPLRTALSIVAGQPVFVQAPAR